MSDNDMEDYGFEYSDDDLEPEDVDIENTYYNAKGALENGHVQEALEGFSSVLDMEESSGEWGFKALKQIVKLHFRLGNVSDMMAAYRRTLKHADSGVTKNQFEKKINSLMDTISQSTDSALLQEYYETTLAALVSTRNERLWFKTNLKLCQLLFQQGEHGRLSRILKVLHRSCEGMDGEADAKKGTQLLEVYALEIQMHSQLKNIKKLKELYQKALTVKGAIPHPRIMGIIRECGGKMHMHDMLWSEANTDFFEEVMERDHMHVDLCCVQAFKSFDEAGMPRRIQCLKYLVLANMLMESKVDPFDSQEAKPYKHDPEVAAMTSLVQAYQSNNIDEFEKILRLNQSTVMDDPFIRQYIEDLLKKIRTQVLLELIKPYTRLRIGFISRKLNVPEDAVEQLLVTLILDQRLTGHIDQINGILALTSPSQGGGKYSAIDKWARQLTTIHQSISLKL